MAKVKVKTIFHDLDTNKLRNQGDEFECSNERANYLNGRNLVSVISLDEVVKHEKDKSEKPTFKKK